MPDTDDDRLPAGNQPTVDERRPSSTSRVLGETPHQVGCRTLPRMTPCPTCGTENPDRARFCAECGTALVVSSASARRGATRKLATIVFIDAAGSTQLGETLDPETVRTVMARYFSAIRPIVEAHGGIVEKFIGDAVMAAFGIPVVHEDDALRAVRSAIEIRAALDQLDGELRAGNDATVQFRTGINTGEVVAGDHASGQAFATGDTVNTAARLQAAAPTGEILLGRSTWLLVRDAVTAEPVEPIVAKGKTELVEAYRLVGVDPSRAGHERRLDRPMIGRSRELDLLRDAFGSVVGERTCRLVTLLGTAGVGKSRLVAEFVELSAPAATVLRGRCLSYGEGVTYWPIAEIIRAAAGVLESESPADARSKLLALLGEADDADLVAARVASAIGLSTDVAPQEEVFWAIRRLLEQLAGDQPLIVVIEDIHWAEPTLLDLIEHIADWSRDAPILLVCPARPELLDARPRWGEADRDDLTITLEPLGVAATRDLIAGLPGGPALPLAVSARLTAAAEGNPLFVEEFLAMLIDDGLLIASPDGAWSASASVVTVRMPPSVKALISARLERLAPEERAVAERASVVGRVFEQAAVTELSSDALRPMVEGNLLALVRKELVRPELTELSIGDAFKFRHILIRDAAYEALPKAERAILHARFADWLEATIGDRLPEYEEIVGYHLEQAHRYRIELGETGDAVAALAGRAGAHLSAAGVGAASRGDLPSGIGLFGRAAALIPPGRQRIELLINLRSTLRSAGDREAADAADAEAVALLATYPDEGLQHHYRLTDAMVDLGGTCGGCSRGIRLLREDRRCVRDVALAPAVELGPCAEGSIHSGPGGRGPSDGPGDRSRAPRPGCGPGVRPCAVLRGQPDPGS